MNESSVWAGVIARTTLLLLSACGTPFVAVSEEQPGNAPADPGEVSDYRLAFEVQPSDAVAGSPLAPVSVRIRDPIGNLVSVADTDVTVVLAGGPAGAALLGTRTVRAALGVARFEDLVIERAGSDYRLLASAPGLEAAGSAEFEIRAAEPIALAFAAMPAVAEGRVPLEPAVEVEARDIFHNRADWAGEIALSLGDELHRSALMGSTSVKATGGLARFDDLTISHPGKGYTLFAKASGLSGAHSDPFDVRLTFARLSLGSKHSCGLTVAGRAYCFGGNDNGQLGTGDTAARYSPAAVMTDLTFSGVSAGDSHSCGWTPEGRAHCWGSNLYGQLGHSDITESGTPFAVAGNLTFISLHVGKYHSCGLVPGGRAYCWGFNDRGQLGRGGTANSSTPVPVHGDYEFVDLSLGTSHTCGVTSSGEALCWGANGNHQLGGPKGAQGETPAPVSSSLTFASVHAGSLHNCGLTKAGSAYCWGNNNYGQLGSRQSGHAKEPTALADTLELASLTTGEFHTCGITKAGKTYCWGRNHQGQLGIGDTNDSQSPVEVLGELGFSSVAAGSSHTCGLLPDGRAYCWGLNGGRLGDGSGETRLVPTPVFGTDR